jgi:putative protease
MELEVFVHGALCIAYSGRCLLSGYFNHRDANQGTCTNSCRWEYRVGQPGTAGKEQERHPDANEVYLLEESRRPGEFMPVFEDENGTYIMNAKDLRAVEHVGRLVAMEIDCLKIEGRTKSHYYAARTTQVYRRAIDDALAGKPFRPDLLTDLEGLANRGYTQGFYRRHAPAELQNYERGSSDNQRQIFVGEVAASSGGWAEIEVKNRFSVGDELELLTPGGNRRFRLKRMEDQDGAPVEVAPGAGYRVRIPVPLDECTLGLVTRAL